MPGLLKQDPQAFGHLKGRRVVRDMADALNEEGIPISFKHVHNVLKDLGLPYKGPRLIARSNDSWYGRSDPDGIRHDFQATKTMTAEKVWRNVLAWLVKMGMTCRLRGSSIQYKRMLPSGNGIIYRNVDGCRMIGYFRPGGSRKA